MQLAEIVSGGQTGADRAALDAAIRYGCPHSGWCPKGRLAEDGPLGAAYQLKETPDADYSQRTEWNVRDSDGTVIFTLAAQPTGGSRQTALFAERLGKPYLHLSRQTAIDPILALQQFVEANEIKRLNVAGSRESHEPGIYLWVRAILEAALL